MAFTFAKVFMNNMSQPAVSLFIIATFNEWLCDLRFFVLFNSISVISGRWTDDDERLCAMELRLRLKRFRLERGSNPGPLFKKASV